MSRVIEASQINPVAVYSDAGVISSGKCRSVGVWQWIRTGDAALPPPSDLQSMPDGGTAARGGYYYAQEWEGATWDEGHEPNYSDKGYLCSEYTEQYGVCNAILHLPHGWSGDVCCDNRNALGRVFYGWKSEALPTSLRQYIVAAQIRIETYNIRARAVLLAGHPNWQELEQGYKLKEERQYPVTVFNVWCDAMCNRMKKNHMMLVGTAREKGIISYPWGAQYYGEVSSGE